MVLDWRGQLARIERGRKDESSKLAISETQCQHRRRAGDRVRFSGPNGNGDHAAVGSGSRYGQLPHDLLVDRDPRRQAVDARRPVPQLVDL